MKNNYSKIKLKFKRRRDDFTNRIKNLLELPNQVKEKFTKVHMEEDYSQLILLQLNKTQTNPQLLGLKEEIDEIIHELEFFHRESRKRRMIRLMEAISEEFNEEKFDIDELKDFFFFGDRLCNIENEHLDKQKTKCLEDKSFCEYTNKLLMDDDEIFLRRKSESEIEEK
jgi:hypothetical protein